MNAKTFKSVLHVNTAYTIEYVQVEGDDFVTLSRKQVAELNPDEILDTRACKCRQCGGPQNYAIALMRAKAGLGFTGDSRVDVPMAS